MAPQPPHPAMRRVEVRAASRTYEVLIGRGLLSEVGPRMAKALGRTVRRCFLVVDSGLPSRWLQRVCEGLAPLRIADVVSRQVPDESRKTGPSLDEHLRAMARERFERWEPLVAIGGGITGDVAGFAAATYRRGIPWVNCPTTLLAMVDASVGGKTGINLELDPEGDSTRGESLVGAPAAGLRKNMIGAFHHPILVLADVGTLPTLPGREIRCGLAECVKHAMIAADFGDSGLLDWTEANAARFRAREAEALIELIARNVTVKAVVVATDEREEAEEGGRALLNLGHTFGHAIETLPGLSPDGDPSHAPLKHGEAVALGLLAACRTAAAMGLCPAGFGDRVRAILTRAGLPTAVAGLPDPDRLLPLLAHDKKVRAGKLRLVLPVSEGRCRVVEDPPEAAVRAGLTAIRA